MDLVQLAKADEEFHIIIYEASGNRRLVQMINNLREQMYRYRVEYLKDAENRQSLITEHDELWESLKRKDFASADKYMKRHIERQMINIRSSLH
jgi:DNA-binding GntR family transcriptional regulator